MLFAAIACFALAALGGAVLGYLQLKRANAPLGLALLHGLLAVVGVILLIMSISQGAAGNVLMAALVLFLVAALGGLALFTIHLRRRPLPVMLIVLHALIAVAAFVALLVGVLGHDA